MNSFLVLTGIGRVGSGVFAADSTSCSIRFGNVPVALDRLTRLKRDGRLLVSSCTKTKENTLIYSLYQGCPNYCGRSRKWPKCRGPILPTVDMMPWLWLMCNLIVRYITLCLISSLGFLHQFFLWVISQHRIMVTNTQSGWYMYIHIHI